MATRLKLKEVYDNPSLAIDSINLECNAKVRKGRLADPELGKYAFNRQGTVTMLFPALGLTSFNILSYITYKEKNPVLVIKNSENDYGMQIDEAINKDDYVKLTKSEINLEIDLEGFSENFELVLNNGWLIIDFKTDLREFKNDKEIIVKK